MNLFDYAIKMEREGEQYYRDQAAKNPDHAISRVFTLLAEAEVKHAQLLQRRSDRLSVDQDLAALRSDKTIFAELDDFKTGAITIPRQLDVYELALGLEKKSIEEYTRLKVLRPMRQTCSCLTFLSSRKSSTTASLNNWSPCCAVRSTGLRMPSLANGTSTDRFVQSGWR
jgi:hypothetical protein